MLIKLTEGDLYQVMTLPEEDFADTLAGNRCRTDNIRQCTVFLPAWKKTSCAQHINNILFHLVIFKIPI